MRLPNKPTIQVTLFTKTLEASFNNTMSLFYNIDCYYTSGKFPHFKMTPAMHEAVPLVHPFHQLAATEPHDSNKAQT